MNDGSTLDVGTFKLFNNLQPYIQIQCLLLLSKKIT